MTQAHFKQSPTCEHCSLSRNCTETAEQTGYKNNIPVLTHKIYHRGDKLFCAGDAFNALYIMRSGSAKACISSVNAEEQIVEFCFPGDLIGADGFAQRKHAQTITFLETSSVCYISLNSVNALLASSELGRQQLLSNMSKSLLVQQQQTMSFHCMTSSQRLAAFLLDLSARLAERGLSSHQLTLSMTRIDIANYLGMAIETISRLLTNMQQQGLIEVQRRQVTLLDIPQLQLMSNIESANDSGLLISQNSALLHATAHSTHAMLQ
tara:strand:- start:8449 stop:9243 length:795 start_codon:yes stop_codon:yes gene_type:complete